MRDRSIAPASTTEQRTAEASGNNILIIKKSRHARSRTCACAVIEYLRYHTVSSFLFFAIVFFRFSASSFTRPAIAHSLRQTFIAFHFVFFFPLVSDSLTLLPRIHQYIRARIAKRRNCLDDVLFRWVWRPERNGVKERPGERQRGQYRLE